jgi:hypothetical protein
VTYLRRAAVTNEPRMCPICLERPATTDEDIQPIWLRKTLLTATGWPKDRQAPPRMRARICGVCNHRLGKVFEVPTKDVMVPMVAGFQADLTPRQQVLIGAWLAKTCIIWSVVERKGGPEFSPSNREYLRTALVEMMATGLPPEHASVRIGARFPLYDNPYNAPGYPGPGFQVPPHASLTSIGGFLYLAFDVTIGGRHDLLDLINRTKDDDRFLRVWPPGIKRQHWPPAGGYLSDADLDALRYVWRHKPELHGPKSWVYQAVWGPMPRHRAPP